ncbi:MAG: TauD/TfdA family dioxygenase [Acetobacteraceae bacterium]|nr:TauD/TfdA family dioxygenase [Acetobacteraceae bacterium]
MSLTATAAPGAHPSGDRREVAVPPPRCDQRHRGQAEGRALIDALTEHAAQDRYIYRHRWREGDLVIWDNRATLHTATLFDHPRYTQLMLRTTVAGEA